MNNVSFESSRVEKEDEVPRFQKDIKTEYKIQMKANQPTKPPFIKNWKKEWNKTQTDIILKEHFRQVVVLVIYAVHSTI